MQIEIMKYEEKLTKNKLGNILVRYGELCIKCELVYSPKNKNVWIRMPEVWKTATYKFQYCFWDTKKKSDEFQKEVLKKLIETYSLDFDAVKALYEKSVAFRKKTKNRKLKI